MAMRKKTEQKINEFKNQTGGYPFKERDLEGYISIQTLFKYDLIEPAEIVTEISIDDLIRKINGMIGEDCYNMIGYYKREGDKVYYHEDGYYKFK